MADSLIEKVVTIERRAEELVERARAQVKEVQEEMARRLKELQARYQAEVDRMRQQLCAEGEAALKQALQDEDRRFTDLREQVTERAKPQVEAAGEHVVKCFFQPEPDNEEQDGH